MVALNQIRSRLRSVENIKKITTSMEMVASARLRKAQIKAKKAQFYILKIKEILGRLQGSSSDYKHPLLVQRKEVRKKSLVIVSSDRGLCGPYNTRIFSEAECFLRNCSVEKIGLHLFGKKAISYYRRKGWPILSEHEGWSGKITLEQIKEFSQQLVDSFLSSELDTIDLVYTRFYNLMHRETVCEPFLPITPSETKKNINYIFEPGLGEAHEHILTRYCMTVIEGMLNQSYAAELAARIFAMKTASHNAAEMEEALILERNKVRQGNITREILETISSQGEP